MFRIAMKGLLAHKLRLLTTALAIMLGVGFMAGTFVFTDTISRTFDNLFADVYKTTDAVVRAQAAFTGPQMTGAQRGRIDASLLAKVQGVPGVATAEGSVGGYARIVDKHGKALGNPSQGAPTVGGSWTYDDKLNVWTVIAGTAPVNDNDVVIDKQSADTAGYRVGDTATVLVQTGPQTVRISGIAKFGKADSPGGASFALFTLPAAQHLVGEPGKFDSIAVTADRGVSQTELTKRLATVLPKDVEAVTGAAITQETQSAVHDLMSVVTTFMMVFAGVSLLVAGFMIFNTFAITVAQRTRESALLRALGASKRQVLWSVLLEALAVGLLASVAGLGLGFVVAGGLKALMAAFGMDIPATGVVFNPRTALVVIPIGTLLTVIAAILPARRAGRVPPIAAMRAVEAGSSKYGSKQRAFGGIGLLGLGAALVYAGVNTGISTPLTMLMLGAVTVFFGVIVLSRTLSLVLTKIIAAPLPWLRGEAGVLARQNAMRNPKRTAASAAALLIGVAVVGSITIMASSWKASVNQTIDRAFIGDYIVDGGGGMLGGLDPSLAAKLGTLPEVQTATGIRMGFGQVDGTVQQILGVDSRAAFSLFDVKPVAGDAEAMNEPGTIAVYSKVAEDKQIHVGDTVRVLFKDTGEQNLRVAMIYGENQPAGNYVVGMSTYNQNFSNRYDIQVFVKRAAGITPAAGLAAVKAASKDYAAAKVMDHAAFKADVAAQINQMLSMVYALLFLAVFIALLGIANTLALAIFERTRELGLLRAVGMTRAQLRQTIRWESVIIALQGALLGTVTGVFFGWALVQAFHDIDVFQVPFLSLAVIIVLAGVAGTVAAIPPSRRAARLDVLKAVVSE